MNAQQFHNALRLMLNIDHHQISDIMDVEEYERFRLDPFRWFIRVPSGRSEALWKVMQSQMQDV